MLIVLAVPGTSYRKMELEIIAEDYKKLSHDEYDAFVTFHPSCAQSIDRADYESELGKKHAVDLMVKVYALQRMTRIGDTFGEYVSSSYIYTVGIPGGLVLPDLEAVIISGTPGQSGAQEVERFYRERGWVSGTTKQEALPSILDAQGRMTIVEPECLRVAAVEKVGYSMKDFMF